MSQDLIDQTRRALDLHTRRLSEPLQGRGRFEARLRAFMHLCRTDPSISEIIRGLAAEADAEYRRIVRRRTDFAARLIETMSAAEMRWPTVASAKLHHYTWTDIRTKATTLVADTREADEAEFKLLHLMSTPEITKAGDLKDLASLVDGWVRPCLSAHTDSDDAISANLRDDGEWLVQRARAITTTSAPAMRGRSSSATRESSNQRPAN